MLNEVATKFKLKLLYKKDEKEKMTTEKEICIKVAEHYSGEKEVWTESGYIDVLNDKYLIEIKNANSWKCGIGQLIAYGHHYPDHIKVLYLFNHSQLLMYKERINNVKTVCNSVNIRLRLYSDIVLREAKRNELRAKQIQYRKERKEAEERRIKYQEEMDSRNF